MRKHKTGRKLLALLLMIAMCVGILPLNAIATSDDWDYVKDTFTLEAVQEYFPDEGFAKVVYNTISTAILEDGYHVDMDLFSSSDWRDPICFGENTQWPENPTTKEIIQAFGTSLWVEPLDINAITRSGITGDTLVRALLENYVGSVNASRQKLKISQAFGI